MLVLVNAERFQIVLDDRGEGEIAVLDDGEFLAVGGVNGAGRAPVLSKPRATVPL